jgi:DNA-binding MltR family transcriptional regulator
MIGVQLMNEWDKYQEEMKLKYPEIFENSLKIQAIYPETDRGATLIVAAIFEEQLSHILNSFLIDSKSTQLLLDGFNAPIDQFSSKIHLCHALGLIEDDEYRQLEGLRKIRNLFAHSFENIDFNTQQIKDLINGNLFKLRPMELTIREQFHDWFIELNTCFLYRAKEVFADKRKSKVYLLKPIRNINLIEIDRF